MTSKTKIKQKKDEEIPPWKKVGPLNVWDKRVLQALLDLWEKAGRPKDGRIEFTISDLIQEIIGGEIKDYTPELYNLVFYHLKRLCWTWIKTIIVSQDIKQLVRQLAQSQGIKIKSKNPLMLSKSPLIPQHWMLPLKIVEENNPDIYCQIEICNSFLEILKSENIKTVEEIEERLKNKLIFEARDPLTENKFI